MKRELVVVTLSIALFACGRSGEIGSAEDRLSLEQMMMASTDPATIKRMPTPEQFEAEMRGSTGYSQDTSEEVEALAICPLELVEPCPASGAGICAVRCCDNYLERSWQVCGNCGEWARGVCANHDTRKRIRWE